MDTSNPFTRTDEAESPELGADQVMLDDDLAEASFMADAIVEEVGHMDFSGLDPVEAAAKLADFISTFMIYSVPPEYVDSFKKQYTMWVGAAFKLANLPKLLENMPMIDVLQRYRWLAWTVCGGAAIGCMVGFWPTPEKIMAAEQAKVEAKRMQDELARRRAEKEAEDTSNEVGGEEFAEDDDHAPIR